MSGLPPAEPDDIDVTRAWIDRAFGALQTALPGIVQRYDATTQTADIQPCVNTMVLQPDGTFASEPMPVIPAVPVVFPRAGGFALTFPVAAGDCVLLVFCAADIGPWRVGQGGPVNPGTNQRHHLSNAVALPGLFPRGQSLQHPSSNLHLGADTASANAGTLEITPGGDVILNGGSAAVGRVGDAVSVTLNLVTDVITAPSGGGPCTGGPFTLTGSITAGAPKVLA